MRRAILVVGSGRSGTSAMAGTLQILGANLGVDLKPADHANAKGYFENTTIMDLNRKLLADRDIPWYSPTASVNDVLPVRATQDLIALIREHLKTVFGDASLIAIKDPRLCLLIDVYVSALQELGYEVHFVRMERATKDVADSMVEYMGETPNTWLPFIWLHNGFIDSAVRRHGLNCVNITFERLATRPDLVVQYIEFRMPFLAASDDRRAEVFGFIDESLMHHRSA